MKKKMHVRVCKLVSRLTQELPIPPVFWSSDLHWCALYRRVIDFADEQHVVVLRSEKTEALAKGVKA